MSMKIGISTKHKMNNLYNGTSIALRVCVDEGINFQLTIIINTNEGEKKLKSSVNNDTA
ncbi:MAG: hypothetical protein ACI9ES_002166 [Oceanospirillaceae bacterium]|jgi:hypothetical protein